MKCKKGTFKGTLKCVTLGREKERIHGAGNVKMLNVWMLRPLGIDRKRASEISDTYESDTYFALQMLFTTRHRRGINWPVIHTIK